MLKYELKDYELYLEQIFDIGISVIGSMLIDVTITPCNGFTSNFLSIGECHCRNRKLHQQSMRFDNIRSNSCAVCKRLPTSQNAALILSA